MNAQVSSGNLCHFDRDRKLCTTIELQISLRQWGLQQHFVAPNICQLVDEHKMIRPVEYYHGLFGKQKATF